MLMWLYGTSARGVQIAVYSARPLEVQTGSRNRDRILLLIFFCPAMLTILTFIFVSF